jgi:demethoxyubiquinone hydroxylase (CLK1/Coq7/Cat5 family)
MASSVLLRRVALVGADVSEDLKASIIRVTRIGELGIKSVITTNRRTLRRNTKRLYHNLFQDEICVETSDMVVGLQTAH